MKDTGGESCANEQTLPGRVAIVTGAVRGIVLAIEQAGASVFVDRDGPGAFAAASEVLAAGGESALVGFDILDNNAAAFDMSTPRMSMSSTRLSRCGTGQWRSMFAVRS